MEDILKIVENNCFWGTGLKGCKGRGRKQLLLIICLVVCHTIQIMCVCYNLTEIKKLIQN